MSFFDKFIFMASMVLNFLQPLLLHRSQINNNKIACFISSNIYDTPRVDIFKVPTYIATYKPAETMYIFAIYLKLKGLGH